MLRQVYTRPPEGDALHLLKGKEQFQSFLQAAKGAAKTVGLAALPDELIESAEGAEVILQIRSSRLKADWTPPRVVRMGEVYYRLESVNEGKRPRPFIYRLRRLAAGVPGRNVILYQSAVSEDTQEQA